MVGDEGPRGRSHDGPRHNTPERVRRGPEKRGCADAQIEASVRRADYSVELRSREAKRARHPWVQIFFAEPRQGSRRGFGPEQQAVPVVLDRPAQRAQLRARLRELRDSRRHLRRHATLRPPAARARRRTGESFAAKHLECALAPSSSKSLEAAAKALAA